MRIHIAASSTLRLPEAPAAEAAPTTPLPTASEPCTPLAPPATRPPRRDCPPSIAPKRAALVLYPLGRLVCIAPKAVASFVAPAAAFSAAALRPRSEGGG